MNNPQHVEKIPSKEHTEWKLNYAHGDFEKIAKQMGGHAAKYRRAMRTGLATEEVRIAMNKFYSFKTSIA